MGAFSDTPNLIAGGDISPCRVVKLSTSADNTGLQATAATEIVIGVAQDTTRRFDSALCAIAGDPLPLQAGAELLIEAGAAITRGANLEVDSNGRVITAATSSGTAMFPFTALESAAGAGAKIKCIWNRGFRVKLS
jgi:hypothetical protein